jgi:spore germination protein GerM
MTRLRFIVIATVIVAVLGAVAFSTGCTREEVPAGEAPADPDSGAPAEDDADGVGTNGTNAGPGEATPTDSDGSTDEQPATAPATVTVRLFWVSASENALGVERTVPYTTAVATAAMSELLAGPSAAEKATWPAISTAIPAGSRLRGVTVSGGVAKVDLSREFASGGGTFSVTARLAQVVYTLTQFPTVDAVEFYIEGVRSEVFSSEGIVLDRPQRFEDYDDLLPIDA